MTTASIPPLVLASGSPRRRDLLEQAGFVFRIMVPEVEETSDPALSPVEMTVANALLKAREAASKCPGEIVLGADTLVFIGCEPLGKPSSLEEAHRMVARLQGRTHQVCTGVALVRDQEERVFHGLTDVTFKSLTAEEIRAYHGLIEPLDKAGGYAAQDHGGLIIENVEGLWSNVVGLPVELLGRELECFGKS